MKMSCTIFWGIILIILGAGILVNLLFHMNIPVVKILFGLFVIYLGICIIVGRNFHCCNKENTHYDVFFGKAKFSDLKEWYQGEKNIVFGSAVIDLGKTEFKENTSKRVKLNVVFGSTELRIPRDMPVKIQVDAAFAGVNLPNGNKTAFGNASYVNGDVSKPGAFLEIHASVVFGSLEVKIVN